MSTSRDGVQAANFRMEAMMKSKQLEVYPDKSCFFISDNKPNIKRIKTEIKDNPVMYGDFEVKIEEMSKHLGDWISERGSKRKCTHI